jgi:hypothetical protein
LELDNYYLFGPGNSIRDRKESEKKEKREKGKKRKKKKITVGPSPTHRHTTQYRLAPPPLTTPRAPLS